MNSRRINVRMFAPAALVFAGLGIGLVVSPMLSAPAAIAEPPVKGENTNEPPFNSTADRKMLITQLTDVNARLGRIEAKLNSGLNVKVTEMPAMKDSK